MPGADSEGGRGSVSGRVSVSGQAAKPSVCILCKGTRNAFCIKCKENKQLAVWNPQ